MSFTFPKNFTWGTATASYQVEGALHEDGRTPSIWDTFCNEPGKIADGTSGEGACDQYHRYPEDIKIMQNLGVQAYRMSIAWPRIVPDFNGPVNQAGIDHYKRLLDALREADIKPVVTLYHWDLPQYLEDRGGWANRDTALRFGDYAAALAHSFGDRVDTWTTLNETWCSAYLGYGNGAQAPGIKDYGKALAAVHHLNLAHGLGIQAVRAELGEDANTSVTLSLAMTIAETDSEQDLAAKRRADLLHNEVFLGPMLDGHYDPEVFEVTKDQSDWNFLLPGDEEIIHQPLQTLGINYYCPDHVRYRDPSEQNASRGYVDDHSAAMPDQDIVEWIEPTGDLTSMGWSQEPDGLYRLMVEMGKRYPNLPLQVTENGSAWDDEVSIDPATGKKIVHDPQRVKYLEDHIRAVANAIKDGTNIIGYFAWSLLDNFEWAFGYEKRFGIIRVDYDTQERIWKDSALRYKQIIQSNSID